MVKRTVFRTTWNTPIRRRAIYKDEGTTSEGEGTPPTTVFITDVNTTESWNDGDTGLIITGTGFRGA